MSQCDWLMSICSTWKSWPIVSRILTQAQFLYLLCSCFYGNQRMTFLNAMGVSDRSAVALDYMFWASLCEWESVKEPLWEGLTNVRIKTTGPFSLSAVMTGEKIRICNQQNLIHSLQEKQALSLYHPKRFRTWPEYKEVYALSWTEALHSNSVCPGNNCYEDTVQPLRHSACYILPKHRGMWAGFKVELEFNGAATAINQ